MSNFSELVGKFIVIMLLVFSVLSFIIVTQKSNNAPDSMENNKIFNASFNAISKEINNASSEATDKFNAFNSEDPQVGFGSILLFSIVSLGKTFSNIVFGFIISIFKLPLIVLGIPATIYSLLIVLLIVVVAVAVWLLYKLGG